MALVVPLASSASVIENILFKVRRGIALSRNASQANPNTGVMVDLPEKIDFEMTLLKSHQSLTNSRVLDSLDEVISSEVSGDSDTELSSTIEKSSESSRGSGGGNERGVGNSSEISREGGRGGSLGRGQGQSFDRGNGQGKGHGQGQGKGDGKSFDKGNEQGNEKSHEKGFEKGQGQGKGDGSGNEQRCTYQDHHAYRYYDKFDTDTGLITGISI